MVLTVQSGTHSTVRSEPSSTPPGSPPPAGVHRTGRGPPVRSRLHTTSSVPLGLSLELCPSPNLLGRSGWVRKRSTAARHTLSVNFRSEQTKANRLVRPLGLQIATSVHRKQHRFTESNPGSQIRKQHQFTERNTGLHNTTGSSWPSQDRSQVHPAVRGLRQSLILLH